MRDQRFGTQLRISYLKNDASLTTENPVDLWVQLIKPEDRSHHGALLKISSLYLVAILAVHVLQIKLYRLPAYIKIYRQQLHNTVWHFARKLYLVDLYFITQ